MSEEIDLDELCAELGGDFSASDALGDFGTGFGAEPTAYGDAYMPEMDSQYYGLNPHVEDHIEDTLPPYTRSFHSRDPMSGRQNAYGAYLEDDIEQFDSSDQFGHGPSSPSPHPLRRIYNSTSSRVTSSSNQAAMSQPEYVQSCIEHDGPQYAYMQPNDKTALQRATTDFINPWQMSAQSSQSQTMSRGNGPMNAHGLRLRPVSELPDMYRCIFKFGVFNAVQSKCYQTIMESHENLVVSAPTGGGKTVLFELGLINLLITSGHQANTKCVYVAPTKALCSERTRDWAAKFEPLGIKCCEMTGDTLQMGKSAWSMARNAKIIITTSEKWDSLTRGWHDHGDFLSEVKLFLVDEVHVLNESRGSTLEVVISRMKARCHNIRFILVSATVPNIRDVANWIGNPSIDLNAPATVFEFGEEYRPCRITRHVYGYPRKNQNDFQFARTLDYKLYSVIGKHACGKPILIFCSTRKGVMSTAEQLLKEYDEAVAKREDTPWYPPKQLNRQFHDKRLEKLAKSGVGVHHAGLSLDDRRATEELYLDGSLRVVCATSTLAVGVNLPAHTVVIKGVKLYVTNGWREYSDLDVVQMIGRAGRPQFDKEGVAIILCEQDLENKYRNLAQGRTILESSLHENLLEHVNSEIGIGAINNVQSAKDWLRGSFLRQRIQKNPGHYHIGKTANQTWEEKLDDMVVQAVKKLETNELISTGGGGINAELRVTEYGDIMSKYYIRQITMQNILKLSDRPSVREILEVISCADELGDVRLRGGDKQVYNKMRDHPDIRHKIKKVEKASDKSFILIQAVLGGISLSAPEYKTSDSQPVLDALSVFRHAARITRVVVEVGIIKKNGAQVKHGLELVRCLTAKAWEDRPVVLKQIESIGEKSLKVLAESGITSLQALRKQESSRIELLLNRRPPYGLEVLQFIHDMPQYAVSIAVAKNGVTSYSGRKPVSVELNIECHLVQALSGRMMSRQKSRFLGMTTILTTTSDLDLVDFRRISTKALKDSRSFTVTAQLTKPSQSVCVLVSSESFAGLSVSQTYKPSVPVGEYPILDTHPKTSTEMFLEECEQDPDFWDKMNSDGESARGTDASRPSTAQSRRPLEPKTLPNGNYACNHTCKDKSACRHICCREGMAKPPPVPKKFLNETKVLEAGTSEVSAAKNSGSKQVKKPEKEDNRLKELEALHKRTGVNKSLQIGEGQRLKIDGGTPARKPKAIAKPNFNVDFAVLKESDKAEKGPDDMPDTQELLVSTQSRATNKLSSSDDSFSNAELDAIMLAVDTTNSPFTTADTTFSTTSTFLDDEAAVNLGQNKRKSPPDDASSTVLSPEHEESSHKKNKPSNLHSPKSDNEPLFLHNSELSSASCPPSYQVLEPADSSYNYVNEDFFTLDDSFFDFVRPTTNEQITGTIDSTVENNSMNEAPMENASKQEDPTNGGCKETRADEYDYGPDEWAEMEDWLLNSGSVRMVGQTG